MTKYKILYTPSAAKEIKKLDGSVRKLIESGLERIANQPEIGKPLRKELKGLYSYRVTSYRILYKIRQNELIVVVIAIGHRKNIYDRIKKALLSLE